MRRLAAVLALLMGAGCAQEQLTLLSESELPADVYGSPEPVASPPQIPRNARIFLVRKNRLEPVTATLQPVADSVAEALLVALFLPRETGTEIPIGTRLNEVDVFGPVATVDVSGDFERAAPPRAQALRIAQVVYTLTEPGTGIGSVRFEIDGVPQQAIGGAQLGTIPGPVSRDDYADFAPRKRPPRPKAA